MNYETVVHHMSEGEPGTLLDFCLDAGLGDDPALLQRVMEDVAYDLAPKRSLSDFVGTKVWPQLGVPRAKEPWGKNLQQRRPRRRYIERGFLHEPLRLMIEHSDAAPENSARKVSIDVIDQLRRLQRIGRKDMSEYAAKVVYDAIVYALNDNRTNKALLDERRDAFTVMSAAVKETVKETVQSFRQITHDETPPMEGKPNGEWSGKKPDFN